MPRLAKPARAAKRDYILIGHPNPSTGTIAAFSGPVTWINDRVVGAINAQGGIYIEVARKFLPAIPNVVGYGRWDGLTYLFELYSGGPCVGGCYCMSREALDVLTVWCANINVPDESKKKLIFIIGKHADVPEKLPEDSVVFVIGDCASGHQNKGNFAVDACAMAEYCIQGFDMSV